MRPDTPEDPAVKSVEEFSDVSAFEIFAPAPHQWVQLGDQLLRRQRHTALCALTYLIHEPADGLLARIVHPENPIGLSFSGQADEKFLFEGPFQVKR